MTPKIGDKFNLLGMEWRVNYLLLHLNQFEAVSQGEEDTQNLHLDFSLADKLDWITPKNKMDEFEDRLNKMYSDGDFNIASVLHEAKELFGENN